MIYIEIVVAVIILTFAGLAYRKIILDFLMQRKLIKSKKYRREKEQFKIEDYVTNNQYKKDKGWLGQRNKGCHPCDLKSPIHVRNYSKGTQFVVKKKGL